MWNDESSNRTQIGNSMEVMHDDSSYSDHEMVLRAKNLAKKKMVATAQIAILW